MSHDGLLGLVASRKPLGEGMSRTVRACTLDASLVLKFERDVGVFQNVKEWHVWSEARHNERLSQWFAPCVRISPCGFVLAMKRTEPLPREQLPERIPSCFTDTKVDNWGLYEGRPVCHDYGTALLLRDPSRLRRVRYWNGPEDRGEY